MSFVFTIYKVSLGIGLFCYNNNNNNNNLLIYSAPFSMEMIKGALHMQY